MTRARALKSIIRARAAKTGERYTTARRHVLKTLAPKPADAPVRNAAAAPPAEPPTPAVDPAGAVTDARCRARTGHDLAHWFRILDGFGAVAMGHTAAARHLRDEHQMDSWYSQGITVAYERARGVRAPNQRPGGYAFSASKVVAVDPATVVAALADRRRRGRWATGSTAARALAKALAAPTSRGFVVRASGEAHYRFIWEGSTVEVTVVPRPRGRSSLVVDHGRLPSREAMDLRRAEWRTTLAALAAYVTRPARRG